MFLKAENNILKYIGMRGVLWPSKVFAFILSYWINIQVSCDNIWGGGRTAAASYIFESLYKHTNQVIN